jgi:hypothetical protein
VTDAQVQEAMRLANLLATARVRKYAQAVGHAALESPASVQRKVDTARANLTNYLKGIGHEPA